MHYYADESVAESTEVMYDDDGESRTSLQDKRYELLHFTAERAGDTLSISLSRSGGDYESMPLEREITLIVHNWTSDVASVSFGDAPVPLRRKLRRNGNSAAYDEDRKRLAVPRALGSCARTADH